MNTTWPVTLNDLCAMSQTELDDAFRKRSRWATFPTATPAGRSSSPRAPRSRDRCRGSPAGSPGRAKSSIGSRGYLLNKVGPFGLHLVKAKVYVAPSWFDGQPAIILDYSKTSLIAHRVRDEIREVSPGLYLGIVFYGTDKTINFVLQFANANPPSACQLPRTAHHAMMTTQSAVTVMADILPGMRQPCASCWRRAGQDAADNPLVPFGKLPSVHFARFFLMDATLDLDGSPLTPRLIFLADVDGPADAFLVALCDLAADGLTTIFGHCQGHTRGLGRAGLLDFLRSHTIPEAARYVNTIGRGVEQIQQEAALRDAIQDFPGSQPGPSGGARARAGCAPRFRSSSSRSRRSPGRAGPCRPRAGLHPGRSHPRPASSPPPASCSFRSSCSACRSGCIFLRRHETGGRGPRHRPRRSAHPGAGRPGGPRRAEPVHVGWLRQARAVPALHGDRGAVGHQFPDAPRLQSRQPDRCEDDSLRATGCSSTRSGAWSSPATTTAVSKTTWTTSSTRSPGASMPPSATASTIRGPTG